MAYSNKSPITGSSKTLHQRVSLAGILYLVSFLLQNLYIVDNHLEVPSHAQVVYQDFTTPKVTKEKSASADLTAPNVRVRVTKANTASAVIPTTSSKDGAALAANTSSTQKALLSTHDDFVESIPDQNETERLLPQINYSVEVLPSPNENQNEKANLASFHRTIAEALQQDEADLKMTLRASDEEADSLYSTNWTTTQQGQEQPSDEEADSLYSTNWTTTREGQEQPSDEEADSLYATNWTTTHEQPQNGNGTAEDSMEDSALPETSSSDHTGLYNLYEGNEMVIFYNVFVPKREEQRDMAMAIVEEQLQQVGNSTAVRSSPTWNDEETANATTGSKKGGSPQYNSTIIYYNTIRGHLNTSFMDRVCRANNLKCYHLGHFDEAFESVTHDDIRQFCVMKTSSSGNTTNITNDENNNSNKSNINVVYMHNKGSFHPIESNTHQRRSMTLAVMSQECHGALESDMCNTCGMVFSPWKAPFFPGNFWTAQCDYVNRLLTPTQFRNRNRMNVRAAKTMKRRGKLTFDLMPTIPETFGTNRYSDEFWVGSHPSIRACDVVSARIYGRWLREDLSPKDIDLQLSPRMPNWQLEGPKILSKISHTATERFKEYFLLAGYIMRWFRLYDHCPPNDSWVWSFFPEGHIWRDAVQKLGKNAVRELINHGEGRTVHVIDSVPAN